MIDAKYAAMGGPEGPLGPPKDVERTNGDGVGRSRRYQHGVIFWLPDAGAHAVMFGPVWDKYDELLLTKGRLGYPTEGQKGVRQAFQGGVIYFNQGHGTHALLDDPWKPGWLEQPRFIGQLISDEITNPDNIGRRQHFTDGHLYWHPEAGSHTVLQGPIWDLWAGLAYEKGELGYPVGPQVPPATATPDVTPIRSQRFQHGSILVTDGLAFATREDGVLLPER